MPRKTISTVALRKTFADLLINISYVAAVRIVDRGRFDQNSFRTIREHEQRAGDAFTYVLLDCDRSRNNVLRPFSS